MKKYTKLNIAKYSCCFNQNYPAELFLNLIKNMDEIKQKNKCDFYRKSPYRVVFKTDIGEQSVVVKQYFNVKILDWVKYLFKMSKAKKEWVVLRKLFERDISVPEPVLMAERKKIGIKLENILVIKAVANAKDLLDICRELKTAGLKERRDFIRKLALFVKQIHEHGIFHRDFHGSNVLVDQKSQKMFLVDFHKVKIIKKLSRKQIFIDLAYLNSSVSPFFNRSEKLFFLYEYFGHYIGKKELVENIYSIQKLTCKFCEIDRPVLDIKKFFVNRYSAGKITNFDFLNKKNTVKKGSKVCVYKINKDDLFPFPVLLKGGDKVVFRKKLQLRKEFYNSIELKKLNINTPEPLFFFNKFGFYLVFRFINSAQSADAYFYSQKFNNLDKKRFIRGLGLFVRSLHAKGIFHKDLKGANILARRINLEKFQFFLIDNGRIKFKKDLLDKNILFNLAQLNASFRKDITDKDRINFLSVYCKGNKELKKMIYDNKDLIKEMTQRRVDGKKC
ncbi:lipopolysaccharide kinase InaA family protein [bacterium]|nr:lipopolysaccharide kinase InaA family protein [bacterium]